MILAHIIAKRAAIGRKAALARIAAGQARVDGQTTTDPRHPVDRFARVELDGRALQAAVRLLHLMLHKPPGILSATVDPVHPTVLDLIEDPDKTTLHIAGRLDRATTGLVLLTNDGRWSKRLMDPDRKVPKVYLVETAEAIPASAPADFARGFHFHTEGLTTRPAELVLLDARRARLVIHEGRYHQVKRMFHRVHCRVTALHRESIGPISLPDDLAAGQWRPLTPGEIAAV